jgi:hypothetical protein
MTTGPVLPQSGSSVIQIMRNVTGRVDRNDPAFTDEVMFDYLNAFLQQQHPQEVRLYQNQTWWNFSIDPTTTDPYPVDLDNLGFSTIGPLAYVTYPPNVNGGNPNTFKLFWYEDPGDFYYRWPISTVFTPQMPTYVLYWNNTLTFRGPPDQLYNIQIQAYRIDYSFEGGSNTNQGSKLSNVPSAYLTRYLAYGASLDILSDYGEMDKYNEVFQVYRRYKGQVLARTWDQLSSQRTGPDF